MTKYYATSWGSMLVGEESVLRRLHLDTPLSDTYEGATARRELFLFQKIKAVEKELERVRNGLPLSQMDDQNRFTPVSNTIASKVDTPHDGQV